MSGEAAAGLSLLSQHPGPWISEILRAIYTREAWAGERVRDGVVTCESIARRLEIEGLAIQVHTVETIVGHLANAEVLDIDSGGSITATRLVG